MKKRMAVIAALIIGVSGYPVGSEAEAAQKEESAKETVGRYQEGAVLDKALSTEIDWDKVSEILSDNISGDTKVNLPLIEPEGTRLSEENSEEMNPVVDTVGDKEKQEGEEQKAKTLQMPQELKVTIDPWEVAGKGQIHSEKYVIQNTGETTGVLTLSDLTCRPREGSGVSVRKERDGIHGDGRKSIYMEIFFGTGERVVLSEEGAEYQTELKPGEEVTLEFAGEVNEYASGEWDNRDIAVGVVYSWELREDTENVSGDAASDVSGDVIKDISCDVSGDALGDVSGDSIKTDTNAGEGEPSNDDAKINSMEPSEESQSKDDDKTKETQKNIDLKLSGDAEIIADSWETDENDCLSSIQYVLRNTGKVPGILRLSNPVYKMPDQSETIIWMRLDDEGKMQKVVNPDSGWGPQDAEELEHIGKECLWIELLSKDIEKTADGQSEQEVLEYGVELNPGEELTVCFFISQNEMMLEELEEGNSTVEVRYSWRVGDEVSSGIG